MNFFKSSFFGDLQLPHILSSQPNPSSQDTSGGWEQQWDVDDDADGSLVPPHAPAAPGPSQPADVAPTEPAAAAAAGGGGGGESSAWSFGGLVKSLTSKSEEVLQAYRRDLQEFSSGLKKETEVIAGVAAHAVKDLPGSLEVGASVAQESLETVGQAIEDFGSSVWRGTVDILAQGKEAILEDEEDPADASAGVSRYVPTPVTAGRYSRFEAQVLAMQHDSSTYCDEPDDEGDYGLWRSTFNLEERSEEMESILGNNAFMQELLSKIVPAVVDRETFWTRYFYRLYKLRQAEEARADLVKRANSEEEDLRWDVDEESEEDLALLTEKENEKAEQENKEIEDIKGNLEDQKVEDKGDTEDQKACDSVGLLNVRMGPGKDDEQANVASSPVVEEEDDSGWEVAEDTEDSSSNEGKKSNNSEASWEVPEVTSSDTRRRVLAIEEEEVPEVTKADIMRRILAIEEEDLSWDVEDEDDGFKP